MPGPNPSLPATPPYNLAVFDTNSGFLIQTVPGSYATLGDIPTFVVPVAGYWRFHATVAFAGSVPSGSQNLATEVQLIWLDSAGETKDTTVVAFTPQLIGQADAATAGGIYFTLQADFLCNAVLGDILFVLMSDLNPPDGSSSYLSVNPNGQTSFEGQRLG